MTGNKKARLLISLGRAEQVAAKLGSYSGLSADLIKELEGWGTRIEEHIDSFSGPLDEIITAIYGGHPTIMKTQKIVSWLNADPNRYEELSADTKAMLLKLSLENRITREDATIPKIPANTFNDVLEALLEKEKNNPYRDNLIRQVIQLTPVNSAESRAVLSADIAERIIKLGDSRVVLNALDHFDQAGYSTIARSIIENGSIEDIKDLAGKHSQGKLPGVDGDEIISMVQSSGRDDSDLIVKSIAKRVASIGTLKRLGLYDPKDYPQLPSAPGTDPLLGSDDLSR